ncbi:hypothetical protein BH09CHL1_BH09CHL1_10380 [soil metagenome]
MVESSLANSNAGHHTFRFSYTPFTERFFTRLRVGPAHSSIDVSGTHVRVRMGWSGSIEIDRRAIVAAGPAKKPFGYGAGVHGKRGQWVFNGSDDGIVKLTFDPPQGGRVLKFPIKPHELYLSLEDPSGFLAEIGFPI